MRRFVTLVAALAGCVGIRLLSQSPTPPQQPLFRVGIDVVQLDVSVLDRNRRPVKGLTQADFVVLENGKPQPIVAFLPVEIADEPDATGGSAPWLREVGSDVTTNRAATRRIVVIVMDDAFIPPDPVVMKYAKQVARSVVEQLGPSDLAAVAYTFVGRNQDITTDHRRLLASIDGLVGHGGSSTPPFSAARGATIGPTMGQGSPCSFRGPYRGPAACVIDTLVTAADALATGPSGRKTLVYISTGVPYDFSMDNPDLSDDLDGVRQLFKSLQLANVNLYAIDPSGLTAEGIMAKRLDALKMFAETTGGSATIATNTPWVAVPQIFRENSSYYLLGFRSTNPAADGRFRRIEVKVDRPDAEVRARSGYYAPRPDARRTSKPAPERSAVEKAITAAMPGGDLPFSVTSAAFATGDRMRGEVVVVSGFMVPPVSAPQTVDLVASAVDASGKIRGTVRQTVRLQPRGADARDAPYDIISRFPLSPGKYQIRVAATSNGNTGSVFVDADVPDFSRSALSMSGLLLGEEGRSAGRSSDQPTDLVPIQPTTAREFRSTSTVTAFLRLYQGSSKPPGAVRLAATITDANNQVRFDQTTFLDSARFSGAHAAEYRLDLPMSRLEAGPHLLTIEASLGRTTIRRDARFTVR